MFFIGAKKTINPSGISFIAVKKIKKAKALTYITITVSQPHSPTVPQPHSP